MGDFDRNSIAPAGKPNDTRKLVFVIALGAVLIGLVAMQILKHGDGPQSAAGAPIANGVALPPPVLSEEISPQALATMVAQLQNDPTKALLQADTPDPTALDAIPRNPFTMSGDWFRGLINAVVVPVAAPQAAPPIKSTPIVNVAQPLAPRREDFKLASIVNGNMAIINGKVVKVGDIVGKARVIQIRDDAVVLQAADTPSGPTTEISSIPRLNKDN